MKPPSCAGITRSTMMSARPSRVIDGGEQSVDPLAGHGRDEHRRALRPARGAHRLLARHRTQQVDLVPHFQDRPVALTVSMPRSVSTASTSRACAVGLGMRDVAHVQDEIGLDHLFERGAEGGDQHGRQVGDEADGVGQDDAPAAREPHLAHGRIERREHLVLGEDAGAGDAVEQRRLAGVGVADDGDDRIGHACAAPCGAVRACARRLPGRLRMAMMRSSIMRRSSSICASPGPPRKPKPPRWRSKMGPGRARAGSSDRRDAPARPAAGLPRVRARRRRSPGSSPVRSSTLAFQARSRGCAAARADSG